MYVLIYYSRTQLQQHHNIATAKLSKKISYEEDLQLPESGSLVQGVSVDPHSAVFGRNGVRLELERQFQVLPLGLPDVTVAYGNYADHQRPTASTYLSSFQPQPASVVPNPNPWHNSTHLGRKEAFAYMRADTPSFFIFKIWIIASRQSAVTFTSLYSDHYLISPISLRY